jgi:hypothetical protein
MRLARRTSLLIAFCLLASAAFAGSLTGDVFVTMRSGDVKRAADVDVLILPATQEFEGEWERLQTEYEERVKPVAAEHDSLKAQYESLGASYTAALSSRNLRAAYQINQQRSPLIEQMMRLGREQWEPLQQEYTQKAMRLLGQRVTARVPTDVNGHFEVSPPTGRYYVFCRYQLPKETLYWLLPAQVQDDTPAKISLSNRSATPSPLRGRTYANF